MIIVDEAVSQKELAAWRERVMTGTQSTSLTREDVEGSELFHVAQRYAPRLDLIHCLLFDIRKGDKTELHRDEGEFAVLFFPYDNGACPLRTRRGGLIEDVEVLANRLVVFACGEVEHMQVVPADNGSRYSVAFKFRENV